jgi:HK97 family phage prohead protease
MDQLEYKYVPLELEEKGLEEGGVRGIAAAYNNVDHGGDVILPGAFQDAISKGQKLKMLWQHDPSEVIGVWDKLTDSPKGLRVEGRFIKGIRRADEAQILLKEAAIDGISIGYRSKKFDFMKTEKGMVRQLKEVELFEASIVTFPMNPKAVVTDVKQLSAPREVETILRNAGVPAAFAKLVASHGFEEAKRRLDPDYREGGEDEATRQEGMSRLLSELNSLKGMMKNA